MPLLGSIKRSFRLGKSARFKPSKMESLDEMEINVIEDDETEPINKHPNLRSCSITTPPTTPIEINVDGSCCQGNGTPGMDSKENSIPASPSNGHLHSRKHLTDADRTSPIGDFFFSRFSTKHDSIDKLRRLSRAASICSEDSENHIDIMDREQPKCQSELLDLVRDLVRVYKKTSQLREVVQNMAWVQETPNVSCDDSTGDTIIHAAAFLGEAKLVSALAHYRPLGLDIDAKNNKGNTPMHLAAMYNHYACVDALLKHQSDAMNMRNDLGMTPLQVAVVQLHQDSVELLLKYGADHVIINENNETLMHLACRAILSRFLDIMDDIREVLEGEVIEDHVQDENGPKERNYFRELEHRFEQEEINLFEKTFPILEVLLETFKRNPDLLEYEDNLRTSPGTILHYFARINYIDGVKILLKEPFLVYRNTINKNGLSALWIAAWYNNVQIAIQLLHDGADPNVQDTMGMGLTPLHSAIYGYHASRVEETCQFIDELLNAGANAQIVNKSGETAAHLAVNTDDLQVISKFVEYLGPEVLNYCDSSGNTLFHYAVGCLDEDSIYKLMENGASLMMKNKCEVLPEEEDWGFEATAQLVVGFQGLQFKNEEDDEHTWTEGWFDKRKNSQKPRRLVSVTTQRLPVQEAMKNGNSINFFNAFRRLDFRSIRHKMEPKEYNQFICVHLVAATREARADIVRMLFQQLRGDTYTLHRILLFCDPCNDDETFTKTALEWAVENGDRLCITEILHQEYECHRESKYDGLKCLRDRLTGDELLLWTVETFTMFYDKTWAQRSIIPVIGLMPLLISIFTFVYDNYSDIDLAIEYYDHAYNSLAATDFNNSLCETINQIVDISIILTPDAATPTSQKCDESNPFLFTTQSHKCSDIKRTPSEYRTAFITNVACITASMFISYLMCVRELFHHSFNYLNRHKWRRTVSEKFFLFVKFVVGGICLFPIGPILAPFFILYIAARHVYFKFKHRRATRKAKVRRQLLKSEYLWGITRISESGLEACGQLILQLWLLSSSFNHLAKLGFLQIVDKTYNGVLFFLSFSARDADETEKSLGKLCVSILNLVFGVAACYRTLKRGALGINNTFFIFVSLTFQIVARILSLGLYFFCVRNFTGFPFLLLIHTTVVLIIKMSFERTLKTKGFLAPLVAIVNILASSLVYVRIVPIERSQQLMRAKSKIKDEPIDRLIFQQHSTFFVQTLYFALVLVENLILCSTPLFLFNESGSNRALECLGDDKEEAKEKVYQMIAGMFALSICGWISHTIYYTQMGHPWGAINGPEVRKNKFSFYLNTCGTERLFSCICGSKRSDRLKSIEERSRKDNEDEQDEENEEMEEIPHKNEGGINNDPNEEVCCNGRTGDIYCKVSCKVVANDLYDSKWCDLV